MKTLQSKTKRGLKDDYPGLWTIDEVTIEYYIHVYVERSKDLRISMRVISVKSDDELNLSPQSPEVNEFHHAHKFNDPNEISGRRTKPHI